MASIVDSLKELITPNLIEKAASFLGEDSSNVTQATGIAIPSILASILSKGDDKGLESILKEAGGSNLNVLDIFSGKADSSIGSNILNSIFGDKLSKIITMLSSKFGISGGSSTKLTGMLGSAIGGFLGNKMSVEGLNLSGLQGLLKSEKSSFMDAIPSELSGVLGLSSGFGLSSMLEDKMDGVEEKAKSIASDVSEGVANTVDKMKHVASDVAENLSDKVEKAKDIAGDTIDDIADSATKSQKWGTMKWLIPVAVVLLIIIVLWKAC